MNHDQNEPHMSQPSQLQGNSSSQAFYVYASEEFAGGRGISIVTTPDRIKAFGNLLSIAPDPNESWSSSFEEHEIPGKGRGLIAKKTLYRGDVIFAHTPILIFDDNLPDWPRLTREAVDKLPVETQQIFWQLYRPVGSDAVVGRIDVNVFGIEVGEHDFVALLPETAVSGRRTRKH
jgi:hypothetical protein